MAKSKQRAVEPDLSHIHESLHSLAVPIESLTPDPRNARRHPDRNMDAIKASLSAFGQLKPIVVQKDGRVIRAGNGTHAAAKALGWTHVAAVITDQTDVQATAFAVSDNRTAELGAWDDVVLDDLLKDDLAGLTASIGFTDLDLKIRSAGTLKVEMVDPATLKEHPRNYRKHPEDQLAHLRQSITESGFFRNVVVAQRDTILAGHGAVYAAVSLKLQAIPIIRIDIDPNDKRALKILTGDNEIANLTEVDDRALVAMLTEIQAEMDLGMLGCGYDDMQLAALDFVTKPPDRVAADATDETQGLPQYDEGSKQIQLIITFETEEARAKVLEMIGCAETAKGNMVKSCWYPARQRNDLQSVCFEEAKADE